MRILFSWRRLDMLMAQIRSEECTGRLMADPRGRKCCSRTTISARLTWRSIRRIREPFMPRSGIRGVRRGAFIPRLMGLGAEYLSPRMVEATGDNLRADSRRNEWAGLE